jgi:Ca2+-binding EF-hand superfamily protein
MTRQILPLLLTLAAASAHAQALPAPAAKPPSAKPPAAAAKPAPAKPAPAASPESASPEQIFAEWDKDKNKQLSLDEFKTGVEQSRMAEVLARLEMQFRKADANSSGKLEAGEYAQLPAIKRGGAASPPFATFDTNKDGGLDPQEYINMVQEFMRRSAGAK